MKKKQVNNLTTERIDQSIIGKERRSDFLEKTVQVAPHIVENIGYH